MTIWGTEITSKRKLGWCHFTASKFWYDILNHFEVWPQIVITNFGGGKPREKIISGLSLYYTHVCTCIIICHIESIFQLI